MALNGSVSVEATPKGQDLLVFSWSAVQDATANTSTVSWIMQLVASTAGEINGVPVERAWSVTVDGQEFTGTANVNISNNETKTLATGQIVLQHNEDGTRSFAFAFSQDLSITWGASSGNPQFIGTVSGSGTGELDAIAEPEPEKFPIKNFVNGLIMALCSRAVQWPKREPKLFLYGTPSTYGNIGLRKGDSVTRYKGVVVSSLPEWNTETHPYGALATGYNNYGFFAKFYMFESVLWDGVFYKAQNCVIYKLVDSAWEFDAMYERSALCSDSTVASTFSWSNYDIYKQDGTLAHQKSDPIPVSGIVDYIDDIPIYE